MEGKCTEILRLTSNILTVNFLSESITLLPWRKEKIKLGEWKRMCFKAEVLAGRGEVLISIRLLVASCQTIRTPIRTNQATSCSPPPPFLFAFYPPTPWLTLTDAFVCSSQNYVKMLKTWVWYSCSSQCRLGKATLGHCHPIQGSPKLVFFSISVLMKKLPQL